MITKRDPNNNHISSIITITITSIMIITIIKLIIIITEAAGAAERAGAAGGWIYMVIIRGVMTAYMSWSQYIACTYDARVIVQKLLLLLIE